jgi:hypothetical protein
LTGSLVPSEEAFMKKLLAFTAAIALAAGVITQAQQAGQQAPPAQAKPEEKPQPAEKADSKAAPSVAGKWNVSIDMQGNVMSSGLEIKLDGKKVAGTITGPQGDPLPIQGEFADGKLTFSLSFDGQNGPIQIAFNGALKENGTLAGTMDFGAAGQGMQVNWTAERVKEK